MPTLTNLDIMSRPDGGNLRSGDTIPVRRNARESKRAVFSTVERTLSVAAPGNVIIPVFVASRGYTINAVTIYTRSGTVTAAVKIGTTDVTALATLSVTATPQTVVATGANAMVAGNALNISFSAGSTPLDLHATFKLSLA
jgi:hypothetical protein